MGPRSPGSQASVISALFCGQSGSAPVGRERERHPFRAAEVTRRNAGLMPRFMVPTVGPGAGSASRTRRSPGLPGFPASCPQPLARPRAWSRSPSPTGSFTDPPHPGQQVPANVVKSLSEAQGRVTRWLSHAEEASNRVRDGSLRECVPAFCRHSPDPTLSSPGDPSCIPKAPSPSDAEK